MITAGRYAEAFLEYADQTLGFENALKQLVDLKSVFRDNPDFKSLLVSPVAPYSEKCVSSFTPSGHRGSIPAA